MRPRPAGQCGRGRAGGAPASGVSLCGRGGGGRRSCGRPGRADGAAAAAGSGAVRAGRLSAAPPRPVQLRRGADSRPVQLRRRLPGAEGGGLGEGAWEPPQLQWRPGRPRLRGLVQLQWRPGEGRRGGPGGSRAGRWGSGRSPPPPPAASYDFSFVVAMTRLCFLVCCLRCFPAAPALRPPPPSLWFTLPLSPSVLCTAKYGKICISSLLPTVPLLPPPL